MNEMTRHAVFGGAGAIAAATASLALAQSKTNETVPMQDPSSKYPQPPFERQSQEWPGLASKMNPKPDHGETSYEGSGRLAGRKALITGGDLRMGRAAAIAFAREGADVAINYYPTEEPDAQESSIGSGKPAGKPSHCRVICARKLFARSLSQTPWRPWAASTFLSATQVARNP